MVQILQEFHQNPQETLARAQHNPQMREFLQQFCSLMGDHFTALAEKDDRSKQRSAAQISEVPSPGECARCVCVFCVCVCVCV